MKIFGQKVLTYIILYGMVGSWYGHGGHLSMRSPTFEPTFLTLKERRRKMIAIIETMDGRTFHRRVEKYTPTEGARLVEELNLPIKPYEVYRARVQSVESVLNTAQKFAEIRASREHVARTAFKPEHPIHTLLGPLNVDEVTGKIFTEMIGEEI